MHLTYDKPNASFYRYSAKPSTIITYGNSAKVRAHKPETAKIVSKCTKLSE